MATGDMISVGLGGISGLVGHAYVAANQAANAADRGAVDQSRAMAATQQTDVEFGDEGRRQILLSSQPETRPIWSGSRSRASGRDLTRFDMIPLIE